MSRFARCLALLSLLLAAQAAWAESPLRFGVLAVRPKPQTEAQWQPLAIYLETALGRKVELAALKYPELDQAAAEDRLDLVLTNPAHFIVLQHRDRLSAPLVTLVNKDGDRKLTAFGGVIFARADDTRIGTLADLAGKSIAAVGRDSLGGYQMQALELVEAGIEQPDGDRLQLSGMPHDLVVEAVLAGRADVGFVRTGVLEALAREGSLKLDRIKVINRQTLPGFPYLSSTRLYPEWPVVVTRQVDEQLARRLTVALLSLSPESAAARAAEIQGFTIPADYNGVEDLLRRLRQRPFDSVPEFTLADLWQRHRLGIVALTALLLMLAATSVGMVAAYRRSRQSLRETERMAARQELLLSSLGEGVYGVDDQGRCMFINPSALTMLDLEADQVIGQDQHRLFHFRREDGAAYPEDECPIYRTLQDGRKREAEDAFIRSDGRPFPVHLAVTPMRINGSIVGAVVAFQDISERKQAELQIRQLAYFDALTGLPNRRMLLDRLDHGLAQAKRFQRSMALIFIDLDNFKQVNDALGHDCGDALLKEVGARLQTCVRASDTIARQGGDEFIMVLSQIAHEADAARVAEKIAAVLGEPVLIKDQAIQTTASIGIAVLPADGTDDSQELMRKADTAMYAAKQAGRNGIRFYA